MTSRKAEPSLRFGRDDNSEWDDGWSRAPHGLWTLDLPNGAKVLLGWLHSHSGSFLQSVTINQARRAVGSSSITTWFDALEQAGFISIFRLANGKPATITLKMAPWRALIGQRPMPWSTPDDRAEIGSVTAPISDRTEEQGEDQSSSLRSEEQLDAKVVREYWDWYCLEHIGLKPTVEYMALRAVARRLLKSGHQPDDIVDAMKTARAWTAKALADEIGAKKHASEGQPSTAAIPHALVRAFAKAQPFFDRRWGGLEKPVRVEAMRRCAQLVSAGYGIGETMVRLAIVVRVGNPMADYALQNVPIPRFEGELDDYADAMERAWTNRTWSVR